MRALTAVTALALLLVSCSGEPARPSPSPTPSSRPPAPILTQLPITAKLGVQGIRVSPSGELLLVVEREGFEHTIFDLSGRAIVSHKLGEVAMNPFWLPDSSGVVSGRRVAIGPGGVPVLDLLILGVDGSQRELVRGVSYPTSEANQVSPDGSSLAFATACCPSTVVVVPRSGGAPREIARSSTQLRVLSWDADGYVVYWSGGNSIDAARDDGTRYQVALGLPAGVKATDVGLDVRTIDAAANRLRIQADGPFPGTAQNNVAARTLVGRELHAHPAAALLPMRVSASELLTYKSGLFSAYDIATGATRSVATVAGDECCPRPTAMSARIVLESPGRTWVRLFAVDRDDRWHETDVGRILQTVGYALSRGRFLVFDEDGAPLVLDGAAARAAPARAALANETNAVVGTVRDARNAAVGKKMVLTWQMPDGAPQSLDYSAGRLVVVSLWTRVCIVCTQQLGLLSDVTVLNPRVEIIAIGVDESEPSALDAAKDHRRLRPLVGSRDTLNDIGVDQLPQTFVLDSDHIVRSVIVGPLSWDALVRALTAASKSRLA
jgi:hypothetical protein